MKSRVKLNSDPIRPVGQGVDRDAIVQALKRIKLFCTFTVAQLETISRFVVRQHFGEGDFIVKTQEVGEALFIVERGEAAGHVGGGGQWILSAGDHFGEVCLVMDAPAPYTIVAGNGDGDGCTCLKLKAVDVRKMLDMLWGGRRELLKRKSVLKRLSVFKQMEESALLNLAVSLERESFGPGTRVVTQGDTGLCMYIVESGIALASVEGIGVVKEYST